MAVEIRKKFAVDLSTVVNKSIDAVRAVRRREQALKEAEFQRAIADGLSYDEQIAIRERQLTEEGKSLLSDAEYKTDLMESINETKKLNRFYKYRAKYATALGEMSAGKTNEKDFLRTLENELIGVEDEQLRVEIQGNIAEAQLKVKQYNDTILSNQVKKAQYDGTEATLNSAIARVKKARTSAALSDNEDEVSAYDETLSALNSQLSTVKIQDAITDFQVTSTTRGTSPVEKLNFINSQIKNANGNTPIKIGDRTYESAAQFWGIERENYLAGDSKVFGDFFGEFEVEQKNKVAAEMVRFGYPTATVLDSTLRVMNELKTRGEIQPYLAKLDVTQAAVMSDSVDKLAKKIMEVGEFNTAFKEADAQLVNIGTKYGVDTSSYRITLGERLANLIRGDVISKEEGVETAPNIDIGLPDVNANPLAPLPNAAATNPTPTPATNYGGGSIVDYLASAGQDSSFNSRASLAKQYGITNYTGTAAQNTQLLTALKTGGAASTPTPAAAVAKPTVPATVATGGSSYTGGSIVDFLTSSGQDSSFAARTKLATQYGITNYTGTAAQNTQLLNSLKTAQSKPATAPAPTAPSPTGNGTGTTTTTTKPATTTPSSGGGTTAPKPTTTTPTPTPPKPTPTPTPTPSKPAVYSGSSIVDYLKSVNKDSSYSYRTTLAKQYGIKDYTGSSSQNSTLLQKLRGF